MNRANIEKINARLNLHYTKIANRTQVSPILELPCITCQLKEFLPTYLALYHHPRDYMANPSSTGVCFFVDDRRFDNRDGLFNAIYYNDAKRLNFYRQRFNGVRIFIEPDYSLCGDMCLAEKVSRRFKMRTVAVWLATELHAIVIPLITYANESSFRYMLDGIEDSNTVAFSTKGSVRNKKHRDLLLKAVQYTVDHMKLRYIVVYSTCSYEITSDLFAYAINNGVQLIIPRNRLQDLHAQRGD